MKEWIKMFQEVQIEDTLAGKLFIAADVVGASTSLCFVILYGVDVKSWINDIFPPFILVITALSIVLGIIYRTAFEIRGWRQRRAERKKK